MQKATRTVEETRKILGLGRATTYDAIKTGEIESIRVGRRILVPTSWLEQKLGLSPGALLFADEERPSISDAREEKTQ